MPILEVIAPRLAVRHDEHSSGISLTKPAGTATIGAVGVNALHDNHTSRLSPAPGAVWVASNTSPNGLQSSPAEMTQ
jgi:hypothetical protein